MKKRQPREVLNTVRPEHQIKNVLKILLLTAGMAGASVLGMKILDSLWMFTR
jgi:hypothetical protein